MKTADPVQLPHLNASQVCHICGGGRPGELIEAFGHAMCRDRVDCYQRFKKGLRNANGGQYNRG